MVFVDREDELEWLHRRYASDEPELLVIYGRRRVGKSELVRESLKGRDDALYFQARETTAKRQLEDFARIASEAVPEVERVKEDWEWILSELSKRLRVVAIDEFPYLIESDSSVPSTFQRVWDLELQNTPLTLVLIGSSLSIMEEKVLSSKSPLFGRRSGTLDLPPMSLWDAEGFLRGFDPDERVLAWSVFGGMPHGLMRLRGEETVLENIQRLILTPGAPLHDEGEFLVNQEFETPSTYLAVLEAIAAGKRAANDIAQAVGIDRGSVGSYLKKLRRVRLIEREVPVTENPVRSRKGRYWLSDPFLDFWFRFVRQQNTRGFSGGEAAQRVVKPRLADHASRHFEGVCQQALPALIPKRYTRIGRWWHKEHEIDIVGLTDSEELVVGECKFSKNPMEARVLHDLEAKVGHVRWAPPTGGSFEPIFVLFSRSGFDDDLVVKSESESVRLFDLQDIVKDGEP